MRCRARSASSSASIGLVEKAQRVRSISSPLMEALGGVAVALVILYGGHQVLNGARTPGTFFSFITALLLAYQPLKTLAGLNANLQEGLAAAQRIFAVLDIEPAIRDRRGAAALARHRRRDSLRGRRFRLSEAARRRCAASTSTFPAGKTVALVGASGAGKSTIINLIPRFYDVGAGAVRIDGQDVRDVTLASLRGAIALVSQEVSLFDDTVRANIAYGRFGASEDEIVAAAQGRGRRRFHPRPAAGLRHAWSASTASSSRAASASASPIARAMLKNAPILLLDEATSALDTESERQVQARAQGADARPHHAGDRASPLDRDRRRPHLCHRRRPRRRARHPCRAAAPRRRLCAALCAAIPPITTRRSTASLEASAWPDAGLSDVPTSAGCARSRAAASLCWLIALYVRLVYATGRWTDRRRRARRRACSPRAGPSSSPSGTGAC